MMENRERGLHSFCLARAVKRSIDVAVAAIGILILSPILGAVVVAIRLMMGRPVLFRQVRPGYRTKPFTLYKFRTMREAYHPDGTPRPDAERLTRLGRLLRQTSLDELPQLWNVLRGGPEPRRSPPAADALLTSLHPRASQTPRCQARNHRLGPSQWAKRDQLGGEVLIRCLVRGPLVAVVGPEDPHFDLD